MKKDFIKIAVPILCIAIAGVVIMTRIFQKPMDTNPKVTNEKTKIDSSKKDENVTDAVEDNSTNRSLVNFSYTVKNECTQNRESAEVEILYKSKSIKTITTNHCLIDKINFFATLDDKILFSILPSGLGGYYIYPISFNVYSIDTNDNIELISDGIAGIIDLYPHKGELSFVKYTNSLLYLHIVDLNHAKTKIFPLSIQHTAQIGHLVFSPSGTKVAIEVGYGPEDERGEIYIFDIPSQKLTRQVTENKHLKIDRWKNENEVVWSEWKIGE